MYIENKKIVYSENKSGETVKFFSKRNDVFRAEIKKKNIHQKTSNIPINDNEKKRLSVMRMQIKPKYSINHQIGITFNFLYAMI